MVLKENFYFMFYMISSFNADNSCSVSQWLSLSTVGLVITLCSNCSYDSSQKEFDFLKNKSVGDSFEIDLTNSEIPKYSIQLDAIERGFGDESLIFNFNNEICPSVETIYYTVHCELTRFRYNLLDSSHFEKKTELISRNELCDRFDIFDNARRTIGYQSEAIITIKEINLTVETKLETLYKDFYYSDKICLGFGCISMVAVVLAILWFILNDLHRFLKFLIEKGENSRIIIFTFKSEPSDDNSINVFRKVTNANKSLYEHSYFQKIRNRTN